MPSAKDLREFRGFLRNATDRQVQGIYDKESRAGRDDYAELAVEEAERRGIELDNGRHHSTKKKSRAQLDREITHALSGATKNGGSVPYKGRLVPIDPSPRSIKAFERDRPYVVRHRGQLYTVVDDVRRGHVAHPAQVQTKSSRSHHATKRAIPGVTKWSMSAGGTSAAKGKYGYTFTVPEGAYHIWPFTTKFGRHAGYLLKFSATGGRPRGSHGGLWHELGTHRSPAAAASAAATHYAGGFD